MKKETVTIPILTTIALITAFFMLSPKSSKKGLPSIDSDRNHQSSATGNSSETKQNLHSSIISSVTDAMGISPGTTQAVEMVWDGPFSNRYSNLMKASVENPEIKTAEIVDVLRTFVPDEHLVNSDLLTDAIIFVSASTFLENLLMESAQNPIYQEMIDSMRLDGISEIEIETFQTQNIHANSGIADSIKDQQKLFSMRFTMNHGITGEELIDKLSEIKTLLPFDQVRLPPR